MKFRLFAIAERLGIDTGEVFHLCKLAGVKVKRSALASITASGLQELLAYVKQHPQVISVSVDDFLYEPGWYRLSLSEERRARRKYMYDQLCERAHAQMIAGTCPWCGEPICNDY